MLNIKIYADLALSDKVQAIKLTLKDINLLDDSIVEI